MSKRNKTRQHREQDQQPRAALRAVAPSKSKRLRGLYVSHNPGARGARMMEATAGEVDWSLLHRVTYRGDTGRLARSVRWSTFEHLQAALEAEQERSDFVLVTQQIGCEWLPTLVSICRKFQAPLIVDLRDLQSMTNRVVMDQGREQLLECVSFHELAMFRAADALIHISPGCQRAAELLHPRARTLRKYVIPCLVRASELVEAQPSYMERSGLVYSGGLGPCNLGTFRNYGELFEQMVLDGVELHIQAGIDRHENPGSALILQQYEARGVVVHDRVPDQELTLALTRFRWGFVGFPRPFPLGNAAFPNKLFEYLAAGVVPVVANAADAGQWVDHYGVGYWCRCEADYRRLPEILTEDLWRKCHHNLMRLRGKWTYDAQAADLAAWLRKVAEAKVSEPGGIWIGSPLVQDLYAELVGSGT